MKKFKKMILIIIIPIVAILLGLTIWFQVYTSELSHLKTEIERRATGNIVNPGYFFTKFYYFSSGTIRNAGYREFVEGLNLDADAKIMNFGCGPGAEAKYVADILAKGKGQLTCFDISETWIDVAKVRLNNYKNIEYVCADITTIDLKPETYDAIVIHYVLHDIPAEIRPAVLNALEKILKPNGKIFICEPSGEGHGMKSEEIKRLMSEVELTQISSQAVKKTFGLNSNNEVYKK